MELSFGEEKRTGYVHLQALSLKGNGMVEKDISVEIALGLECLHSRIPNL